MTQAPLAAGKPRGEGACAMKRHPVISGLILSVLIVVATVVAIRLAGRDEGTSLFSGRVGVVLVRGTIIDSLPIVQDLQKFRRDDSIKAVVLRVNSGGGGVAPSQEIYREVVKLRRVKPVVASLGGVAASGGYYVASPATKVVCNPGTVTGSIGVIMSIPELKGLFDKLGIRLQVIQAGALKATGVPDRPLSPAERAWLQDAIDDTHDQFIRDVARARHLPVAKVRRLANGGIFTGRQAFKLGLVDRLGSFTDAVQLAARLGGIEGRPRLVLPDDQSRSWWRRLLREEGRSLVRDLMAELAPPGLLAIYRPSLPQGGGER